MNLAGRSKTFLIAAQATAALIAIIAVELSGCSRDTSHEKQPEANPLAIEERPVTPAKVAPPVETSKNCAIQLHDVSAESGITFTHSDGSSGRRYVVEAMSTGIATLDYDGDGLVDIYFPNGAPLPGAPTDNPPRHALYRNLGNWKFEDVTEKAGIICTGYGMGVTAADFDADGDQDIYLSNFGPNFLFRNNGDGTFTDVTREMGVGRDANNMTIGAGVAFVDVEADGLLDLYVGNYIALDCAKHTLHTDKGFPAYPSPREYDPIPDTLYRNNGERFTDESVSSGVASYAGRSMGLTCADIENDGDEDIFICNDVMENFLLVNDGKGHFKEMAMLAGTALGRQADMVANMAVDAADFDRDGLLDFYTTNYQGQLPMLFRNLGEGMFTDMASETGADADLYGYVKWGCGWVDFDNDGRRDLFVLNGHTEDNIEERDRGACWRCPNVLLRQTESGKFVNISDSAGDGLKPVEASRAACFDDLDNDGDADVVILNSRAKPTILRNMLHESGCNHHWLNVRLYGTTAVRDGIGSHVTVVADGLTQMDEVHAGRGYQSHWGTSLHFGLGPHERVKQIEVRWHGGQTEVFENIVCDRSVTLIQGTGRSIAPAKP